MAKIICLKEMAKIVMDVADKGTKLKKKELRTFTGELAILLTHHFGGDVGTVMDPDFDIEDFTVGIHWNDSVDKNGGPWQAYDTDVSFKEGDNEGS